MQRELLELERLARELLDTAPPGGLCHACMVPVDFDEEGTRRELELALVQLDLAREREKERAAEPVTETRQRGAA